MDDKTKIVLGRLACGTAILITHAITGIDGTLVLVSLFLLGVPVEYASSTGKKNVQTSESS